MIISSKNSQKTLEKYAKGKVNRLTTEDDLNPLIERIGDARIVMLGEASHGTHEYYTWRAQITKRLIEESDFNFVAVEGDWPDCYKINRFIKNYKNSGEDALGVLHEFERWPTWMWANWEIKAFIEWLSAHNKNLSHNQQVGFYGLDVYSLWDSILSIIAYLDNVDPEAANNARRAAKCFEPYESDFSSYARSTRIVPEGCENEVIELLQEVVKKMPIYDSDQEAVFSTQQNAYVAVNAEKYYRAMIEFGPESWNIRDRHMADTLDRLLVHYGKGSKAVIWEHNTHIGDARATSMSRRGLLNIGQVIREKYDEDNVVLVGFGSYKGSVIAGDHWEAPMKKMPVPPAKDNSWEALLHELDPNDLLMIFDQYADQPKKNIDHRAIGVVYDPDQEKYGNYVPSLIPYRYDAFIHIDKSHALHPLKIKPDGNKTPETYPFNV